MTDDLATTVFLVLAALFAYRTLKARGTELFLPLVWFLSLLAVAPFNDSAWRFSYEALVPLTLMAGFAIISFLPKPDLTKKRDALRRRRIKWNGPLFVVMALLFLLVGSWGQTTVANVAGSPGVSSAAQQGVYSALYWMRDNTPENSSYLSVSDWRFTYTGLMIGRQTYYAFESNPADAIALAKQKGSHYVIVTNIVTAEIAPVPSLFPWNNFPTNSTSSLSLV